MSIEQHRPPRAGATRLSRVTINDVAREAAATAIVAFSDYVAFGALARLGERSVSVPGDVSLTGFDDVLLSRLTAPRLTTVTVRKQELGRRAWELLFEERGAVTFTPELVVRDSTAPPRTPARVTSRT